MDLTSSCKDKLSYFRVKELKHVLLQLGLGRNGRKQDLVDRIESVLHDEQFVRMDGMQEIAMGKDNICKIIDETYRQMQISNIKNGKRKEELGETSEVDMNIRCLCGSMLPSESMIQCEDPRCHVWQHKGCVIIPETYIDDIPPVRAGFYCELCRINRADPFWVTVVHPLNPQKLLFSNSPPDESNPMQSIEITFQMTRTERDILQTAKHNIQVWCILLNDKVPFRLHWPQHVDLQVNGIPIKATNRPGSQLLGFNGRDDGPVISTCTTEGINKISLSACDPRTFCLGVRIARELTFQQVLNMIPKEEDGEHLEDALARVCRCIGGGNGTENADSGSDLEVVAESVTVSLRCPLSGSRMKIAGRFKPCAHMGCFDLETLVELNHRSKKWQCPICLKNYSLESVIIDPFFNRITTMMRNCGEDVTEIDVRPEGLWRAKKAYEDLDLGHWHFPDGSVDIAMIELEEVKSKQMRQDGVSEGHSGQKNCNGGLRVNKTAETLSLSSSSQQYENHCLHIALSSSASGRCRVDDDPSVNQDSGAHCDTSTNGNEFNCVSRSFDHTGGLNKVSSTATLIPDIISISDSDDEQENLVSPASQPHAGSTHFSVPSLGVQTPQVPSSFSFSYIDLNLSLVNSPLVYNGNVPSPEVVAPTSLPAGTVQSNFRGDSARSSGLRPKEWISLRVGGSDGEGSSGLGESAGVSGLDSRARTVESIDDNATVHPSVSADENSNKTHLKRQSSFGPFSFPRQTRTLRPRN